MKLKAVFRCRECSADSLKWSGQCPGCGSWNTLEEEAVAVGKAAAGQGARPLTDFSSPVVSLKDSSSSRESGRLPIGIGELDRLLGGGLVAGQVLLLAGPPGIGKSTLMLQAAASLARSRTVLYVSGEESLEQVSSRARRLGLSGSGLLLACESDLEKILAAVSEHGPAVLVLDSIQTVFHPGFSGGPGSMAQVRECAAELLRAAKSRGTALFLLGHVTKDGATAGPKVLEHIVDTVLQFDTEERQMLRLLRAEKNRFGPTSEVALFEMEEKGLKEVQDASAMLLEAFAGSRSPGRAVSVAVEGTRPMLVEVQALVTPTRYPLPRRMATGLELNRVLTLLASMEKHLRLRLESQDVFINLAGGLRLKDPALDLAVCMAVVSSAREVPLPEDAVFIGEVGLLGGVGRVGFAAQRLREAQRVGFKKAFVGARSLKDCAKGARVHMDISGAKDISEAVRLCLPEGE
ncbi:MAG: DNA repair protein RadA [Elusimicrobiota bacterium]